MTETEGQTDSGYNSIRRHPPLGLRIGPSPGEREDRRRRRRIGRRGQIIVATATSSAADATVPQHNRQSTTVSATHKAGPKTVLEQRSADTHRSLGPCEAK